MRSVQSNFRHSIYKFLYIASASVAVSGFIIECILLHLIIAPYGHETEFINGTCVVINITTRYGVKCVNKCSKERSKFYCSSIRIKYQPKISIRRLDNKHWYVGYLFDQVTTLHNYKHEKVRFNFLDFVSYFVFQLEKV